MPIPRDKVIDQALIMHLHIRRDMVRHSSFLYERRGGGEGGETLNVQSLAEVWRVGASVCEGVLLVMVVTKV